MIQAVGISKRFRKNVVLDGFDFKLQPGLVTVLLGRNGAGKTPLLVTFDPESTSARLFVRKVGTQTLTFDGAKEGLMKDRETGTLWIGATGRAVKGRLRGKRLEAKAGIMSCSTAQKPCSGEKSTSGV